MLKKPWGKNQRSSRTSRQLRRPALEVDDQQAVTNLGRRHRPDYLLVMIPVALVAMGLIVVYSISPGLAVTNAVSENYFVSRQLMAIGLGLVAFLVFSFLPLKVLTNTHKVLIALALAAAIAVQIFGEEINGAARWIQFSGLSFQVAELLKFVLIVWMAVFLVRRIRADEMRSNAKTLWPLLAAMVLIGLFVANPLMQSDLGSAGVMIVILGVMAFTAGLPLGRIGLIGAIVLIGTLLAVGSSSYRRDRVTTFLNPTQDYQAAGYQSYQARIAVGSGGLFGRGLAKSTQGNGGYIPEAANDSIFAVFAEKFGFLGVTLVIGLYVILFSRLRRVIAHSQDLFARLFVVGVLAWLSTQAIINIGAMIGLLPLKGITLPLVSYGGTSLVFVMAALGIVFQVSRYTSFSVTDNQTNAAREGERYDHRARRGRQRRPHYTAASSR